MYAPRCLSFSHTQEASMRLVATVLHTQEASMRLIVNVPHTQEASMRLIVNTLTYPGGLYAPHC